MTVAERENVFISFLVEHGVGDAYWKNFADTQKSQPGETLPSYKSMLISASPAQMFLSAFEFNTTPEGIDFLIGIYQKWCSKFKTISDT